MLHRFDLLVPGARPSVHVAGEPRRLVAVLGVGPWGPGVRPEVLLASLLARSYLLLVVVAYYGYSYLLVVASNRVAMASEERSCLLSKPNRIFFSTQIHVPYVTHFLE